MIIFIQYKSSNEVSLIYYSDIGDTWKKNILISNCVLLL